MYSGQDKTPGYNEREYLDTEKEGSQVGKKRPCWIMGLNALFCMLTEGVFQGQMLVLCGPIQLTLALFSSYLS